LSDSERFDDHRTTQRRVEALTAELARIRDAANIDVGNLQNDIVAKNREIGRLKADLAKAEEAEPEHDDTHELLMLWKALTHRNGKTDIKPGGKRYKLVKAASSAGALSGPRTRSAASP
jgi:hypothetical protein